MRLGDSLSISVSSELRGYPVQTLYGWKATDHCQLLYETGVSYECETRTEQDRSEAWHETEVMGCQS